MVAQRGKADRAARSPEPRAPRRRRALRVAASILVIASAAGWGAVKVRDARYRAQLPPLPKFSHEPAALRDSLENADRAARAAPTSADAVGALGLAYHANMFYEQADRSYAIAEALGGGAAADPERVGLPHPWSYYRALVYEARGDPGAVATALQRVVTRAPAFAP